MKLNDVVLSRNVRDYVNDCLMREWIGVGGKYVRRFEVHFARVSRRDYNLAVNSGTAALLIAKLALGIGKGDHVAIPDYTCSANLSTTIQCGAVPVYVDVEAETYGMDFERLESIAKLYPIKAVEIVHVYGFPARDTIKISEWANENRIKVIQDCSEAHGAELNGKKVSEYGDIAVFSCRAEKMVGVGEGAIAATSDLGLYEKMRYWANRGKPWEGIKYWVTSPGYNFLMSELPAAVGFAQLEELDALIKKKRDIWSWYKEEASDLFDWQVEYGKSVCWLTCGKLKATITARRDDIERYLAEKGIETRPPFYPLHKLPVYPNNAVEFARTEEIFDRCFILPSSPPLVKGDTVIVANRIREFAG